MRALLLLVLLAGCGPRRIHHVNTPAEDAAIARANFRRCMKLAVRPCDNEAREAEMAQQDALHKDAQRQAWGRTIYTKP